MVVIRTSVRSLQASSGLSGPGHYHWLISGFWSRTGLLRIRHTLTHTHTHLVRKGLHTHTYIHTHNGLSFRYDCYSSLPYRVRVPGSSHQCLCGGGRRCDWLWCHNRPIRLGGGDAMRARGATIKTKICHINRLIDQFRNFSPKRFSIGDRY